jgi:hypothetical protein
MSTHEVDEDVGVEKHRSLLISLRGAVPQFLREYRRFRSVREDTENALALPVGKSICARLGHQASVRPQDLRLHSRF